MYSSGDSKENCGYCQTTNPETNLSESPGWNIANPRTPKTNIHIMIQILRVNAGGELSTDRPCRFPVLVRVMLYGAIYADCFIHRLQCRFTWSQSVRSTLSCPDSSLSLSRCATLLRRRIGRSMGQRFDWSVARHYNVPVGLRNINTTAAPCGRQAPLSRGVLSL